MGVGRPLQRQKLAAGAGLDARHRHERRICRRGLRDPEAAAAVAVTALDNEVEGAILLVQTGEPHDSLRGRVLRQREGEPGNVGRDNGVVDHLNIELGSGDFVHAEVGEPGEGHRAARCVAVGVAELELVGSLVVDKGGFAVARYVGVVGDMAVEDEAGGAALYNGALLRISHSLSTPVRRYAVDKNHCVVDSL